MPSKDLLTIFRRNARTANPKSMTMPAASAFNGSAFCLIPGCALHVSLSTTGDRELYEVDKDHGTVPLHLSFSKPATFSAVPTYSAVIYVAFVGILAGLGNGLKEC